MDVQRSNVSVGVTPSGPGNRVSNNITWMMSILIFVVACLSCCATIVPAFLHAPRYPRMSEPSSPLAKYGHNTSELEIVARSEGSHSPIYERSSADTLSTLTAGTSLQMRPKAQSSTGAFLAQMLGDFKQRLPLLRMSTAIHNLIAALSQTWLRLTANLDHQWQKLGTLFALREFPQRQPHMEHLDNDRLSIDVSSLNAKQRDQLLSTHERIRKRIAQHLDEYGLNAVTVDKEVTVHLVYRYFAAMDWRENYNGKSYEDAVVDSLRWRHQQHLVDRDIFQPYFSSPNVFKDIMERGLCYVSHYTDNARRALIYFRVARYMPVNASRSPSTLETYNELIALTVERASQYSVQRGSGEFTAILDLQGYSWDSSPPLSFIKQTLATLKQHYPHRVHTIYLVNASGAFLWLWRMLKPLLPKKVLAKTIVVATQDVARVLGEELGVKQVETDYGGLAPSYLSIMR